MASDEILRDYEVACEELLENCKKVQKNQELFIQMANSFHNWVGFWQENPDFWKVEQKGMGKMIGHVKNLNKQVLKVLEIEQNGQV